MRHSTGLRVLMIGSLLTFCLAATPSQAAEEAWRFLEGLRERGYHDMAIEYLQRIRTSPDCPADLKEVIDYEAGTTLVAGSVFAGPLREQQLEQAGEYFKKFVQDHPNHELVASANTQLANNVLSERGRIKAELGAKPSKTEEEKKQLMAEARTYYQEAQKVFTAAEKKVYEQAKPYEGKVLDDRRDAKEIEIRDAIFRKLLQARLYLATVVYQIGKTYDPGSKEYKDNLTIARDSYAAIYGKYSEYTAGLFARMQEGRVHKDLGDTEKAIQALKEMLTVPGGDDTARMLRNQSLGLLLETYLLPKVKEYEDALARAKTWQDEVRGGEESSPDGLKIHFLAGKAALLQGESLKKSDPKQKDVLRAARQHFEFVSRFPGEFQREARNMLTHDLLGGELDTGEPKTFTDAKDQGDFAWGTFVLASGKSQQGGSKEQVEKTAAEMRDSLDKAVSYYNLALGLKTDETPPNELNLMRFRLAYLYWNDKDYYRAAVVGEFLARRYPGSIGARQGAEIAVKAYRALYQLAPERKEERIFELRHMESIADYISSAWPGEKEADEAVMMLLETAVDNRDLDKARENLEKLAPDSPKRAQAELRIGQALWASYVQESNKEEGQRLPQEELDKKIQEAKATLEQGISRMRKAVDEGGTVDYMVVYSVLSLAQIYIGSGQSEDAVNWLDDPKIGPITLVAEKHPATDRGDFRVEAYKAGLRAYVGAQQLDKAEKAMEALETLVSEGGDAAAAGTLTKIYLVLGKELQDTLKRLRQEDKNQEAEKVADGFKLFLDKISSREKGNTFGSRNWVAETYLNLGAGLDPGGEETPPEAKAYYTKAAEEYLKILKECQNDENHQFAPAGAEASIKVRLAACLRPLGKHAEAMKLLVSILKEKEKRVDVQIEAAKTYQDWAKLEGKSGYYSFAIKGGQKQEDGRYLVWGWGGIAKRVEPFPQYEAKLHEARYNLALCRFKLAKRQPRADQAKTLEMAELDVTRTHLLWPTMGGEEWFDKYDSLLKDIQRARGQKRPPGLKRPSKTDN